MSTSFNYDVIIAGGGPAGASSAIHLAMGGARVLLAEQKKFPRPKLCGEFISPECTIHFERLGVSDQMLAASPATLSQTVFYSRSGSNVTVPSSWFGSTGIALGLSRAEMDEQLLRRADAAGAQVLEDAQVTNLLFENEQVKGVSIKAGRHEARYQAAITIDATGRARVLSRRLFVRRRERRHAPASMIAFKAHFQKSRVAPRTCEIYFYPGGYGGLTTIENGFSNLCFIASARDVRARGTNADRVMREVVCQNRRASLTLGDAQPASPWLAVALEGFGRHSVAPAKGLVAAGDAASFIDPFTGSGMLMALESGALAAKLITAHLNANGQSQSLDDLRVQYATAYNQIFDSRLRICSLMRRAAFVPGLAELAIGFFGASDRIRLRLARATRGSSPEPYSHSERAG